ncbi:hypothetical protein [Tunturiibacter lichenicola]|uniref:hypothetical protein n=1 Tax=Tunturiibacter lichenicola TaxID=2051959 RepID=UPI003D9B2871
MPSTSITRRSLFGMVSTAAVAGAMPSLFAPQSAHAQLANANPLTNAQDLFTSLARGFSFQNLMMDAYASGSTIRLSQSYSDAALLSTGFTYDNAVAIHAYLSRGQQDDLARAKTLGLGLLHAQATNFPVADGRFAQAYFVNAPDSSGAFITPAAFPFFFYGSSVGDQAWAGMALAQLYRRTRDKQYLTGALLVANWIVTNTYNTQGPGGYSYGAIINQFNQSQPSPNGKSTEGNLDTYAFFTMLHTLTDGGCANNGMTWTALAQHAIQFVFAMFNPKGPFFYTGTLPDQITINPSPIPEDCQTWSYLAFLDARSRGTIDWALANLQTTDTASSPNTSLTGSQVVHGMTFSDVSLTSPANDPHAVWLEGTAHTAAALTARVLRGGEPLPALLTDITKAVQLLKDIEHAQQILGVGQTAGGRVIPSGLGIVASSSVLDTGFGFTYGPSLHIGATGWYLIAGFAANPFQLGYRVIG